MLALLVPGVQMGAGGTEEATPQVPSLPTTGAGQ